MTTRYEPNTNQTEAIMARGKKGEGAEVRRAIDGPQINAEELLARHYRWKQEETDAASEAGARRQEIGATAEAMSIENKAFSQFRAGMKIKNEGKRRDWYRSLAALLEIARDEIMGNELPLQQEAAAEPTPAKGRSQSASKTGASDPEIAGEAEAFEKHVEAVVAFGEAAE